MRAALSPYIQNKKTNIMRRTINYLLLFAVALSATAVVAASCSDENDCSLAGRKSVFFIVNSLNEEEAVVKHTLDSLTVTAMGTDSILLNKEVNVSYFSLPLKYTEESTTFVFQYTSVNKDTVTIRHTNTPKFISMDCGYEMEQTIGSIHDVKYTEYILRRVDFLNGSTNTDGTTNLRLVYY